MSMQPISASASDSEALREISDALASQEPGIVSAEGEALPIPAALVEVLREAAAALLAGRAVTVHAVGRDLTTQQAADLLNVSRPHLIKLLERQELPCTLVGTHRRLRLEDVLAYEARRRTRQLGALNEIARLSQDLGLV